MNIVRTIRKNKLLAIVILAYIILLITSPQKAKGSVGNSMYYVIEMIQIMPVIFILTSLIEAWVPRETIIKGFGEGSGIRGSILSFLLGSFSAGPLYAAFPICKMLLQKGASISNIIIILSSWAVVKVPMLANEAKFLGPKFMGMRWILTTVSIFAMAYITSIMVKKKDIPAIEKKRDGETLTVQKEYCIGCGICIELAPEYFELKNGKAGIIETMDAIKTSEEVDKAIKKCPTNAIEFR
ncbi:MAG: permease [Clostridiales bacterium]|nr:permease [Clostridiales bacterium]